MKFDKSLAPKRAAGFRNLEQSRKDLLKVDSGVISFFNPVEKYVEELKTAFSNVADFYYDFHGGSFIGVKWKHENDRVFDFKINLGFSCVPVHKQRKVFYNISSEFIYF